jgi:NADH-quinone oxidoreductase subunit L
MIFAIAIFAPLAGALVSGLLGKAIGDKAAMGASVLGMVVAAICGPLAFFQLTGGADPGVLDLGTWIEAGRFHVDVYSIGYMGHDARPQYRFFAYLSLFSFAMLMLVSADNLAQLFFGWEGVGLCSYLLIGYWYDRPSACAAAMKAFIVNRIADLPFAVGIALIYFKFGSIEFSTIFPAVAQHAGDSYALFGTTFPAIEVIAFLLFIGAMGKSAQLGFHVWLPDAMEGPTPVSALIHAATMVTAGVFLMARMSPLMEYAPYALGFVTFIGGSTALFAATIGCVQNDIKRVIAYSTCSQLGYMFVAAGVGVYQASVFHLITHAFFKALLFLCAGSVIHAMSDEQDMRKMGGLWRHIPYTYGTMWVGSLALAGIFPFAGYWSKDAIISAAWASGSGIGLYGWVCTVLAAFLTAFYSGRLLFMTFHGKPRADHHVMEHVHESPWVMIGPLCLLAVGATIAGWLLDNWFIGAGWPHFWNGAIHNGDHNHVIENLENLPFLVQVLPLVLGVLGLGLAWLMYIGNPLLPVRLAQSFGGIYRFLLNKWYFDELYNTIFVQPTIWLARQFWQVGDVTIIDGVPNGLAELAGDGSREVVKIQTGSLAVYAFAMLIGVVVLVGIFMLSR